MSAITDHAQSMLAYNRWANGKVLDAAAGLSADTFKPVSETLAHTVGTQLYWAANWRGGEFVKPTGELSYADIKSLFERSNDELDAFGAKLTDVEWDRSEAWWKQFGIDAQASVGMALFQMIYHGIQHRAEVAVTLTEHDRSPGDLDYLMFLRGSGGAIPI